MLTGATPLVSVYRQNTFDEFTINFADKLMQSYTILWHTFNNVGYNGHMTSNGIILPSIPTMDNTFCIELLQCVQIIYIYLLCSRP